MKGTFTLFFFMLVCGFVSHAQIRRFDVNSAINNIIREMGGDSMLVYTEVSPTESYFLLYVEGEASSKAFRLAPAPSFLEVYDVRIWGKYAYFCGSIALGTGGNKGLVGRFNIQSVFSGTDYVEYGIFDSVTNQDFHMKSLRRMDIYSSGGYDCMAMVGVAEYSGQTIYPVASAYVSGGSWHFHSAGQKNRHKFTDIACLDNLIVATGLNVEDSLCFVDSFWPYIDFPAHECDPGHVHDFTYGKAVGSPLIAHVKYDDAVLSFFNNPTRVSTVVLYQPFDTPTGKPLSSNKAVETTPPSTVVSYNSSWTLLELTVVDGDAFLLQHAAYPVAPSPSTLYDWRLRTQFTLPVIDAWSPKEGTFCSMDVTNANRIASISYSQELMVHGPAWPQQENWCQLYQTIDVTELTVGINKTYLGVVPVEPGYIIYYQMPTVFTAGTDLKCLTNNQNR